MTFASLARPMPAARTMPMARRDAVCYFIAVRPGCNPPGHNPPGCNPPMMPFEMEDEDLEPAPLPARQPRGEILRDAGGRLYERVGQVIRPLDRLAVTPTGEIVEVPESPKAMASPAEPLLREPRVFKRLLVWGAWKEQLAGQMARPERLTDTVKVPCDVSVFELSRPGTLTMVQKEGNVFPLDAATSRRLGLEGHLPPAETPAAEGESYKQGSRFYRLVVARDPTVVPPVAPSMPPSMPPPVPRPPSLRRQAPERYQGPWEFQCSREEAIGLMERDAASAGTWRNRLIRALRKADEEQALAQWRQRLAAKSLDDQLWAVRPPQNCWRLDGVREWLEKTLAQAGYHVQETLREWEIYWRRKGV